MAVTTMIGAKIHRREDPRLVSGRGRYVDDLTLPGMVHMAVVRSPYAHARVTGIDVSAAKESPGVLGVFPAEDFKSVLQSFMPVSPAFVPEKKQTPDRFPIASDEVVFQGEPVAVVVAESRYQATDVAGLVMVDNRLTVWQSSQNPHFSRIFIAAMLGMNESQIRVISADVGGGFGSKISPYPEDYLVPACAKLVGRPVKWVESRTESIQTTTHGRGQYYDVEIAAKRDGTLLGLRVEQVLDMGAYCGLFSAFQTCACLMAVGVYKWPAVSARTVGVLTNKVPTDPYRGAGRPEATHLVERMMDVLALEIGMDPAELRRKNFVRPEQFPYTNLFGLVYDSGDYDKTLSKAMEIAGYEELRREQEQARQQGRLLGIGISTWFELCGFGPSAATATGSTPALVESAHVRVFPSGSAVVYTGTHSHGQGHETTFAQIAAETLGLPYEAIEVRH